MLVPGLFSTLRRRAIVFNSTFNRSTFLSGLKLLFDSLPDALPDAAWQRLQRSVVIPVPVALEPPARSTLSASADILEVLWNHRWEYDKGPRLLLAVLCRHYSNRMSRCACTLPASSFASSLKSLRRSSGWPPS